jgi:hypothetical protein
MLAIHLQVLLDTTAYSCGVNKQASEAAYIDYLNIEEDMHAHSADSDSAVSLQLPPCTHINICTEKRSSSFEYNGAMDENNVRTAWTHRAVYVKVTHLHSQRIREHNYTASRAGF